MNTKKWTCKDGRKIRIKDMDDGHLTNTIKFLKRQHAQALDISPPCFQGEMAQMYAEQEYDNRMSSEVWDLFPIYMDMVEEAERRGLK